MAIPHSDILEKLQSTFGSSILNSEEQYGLLSITIDKSINLTVLQFLYDDETLKFQFLTDLCGVHYPDQEMGLVVVCHLHSLTTNTRIKIKFPLLTLTPVIQSLTPLYAAANWMERETYDFYGIIFEGHPNLKRILNVDSMEVFPMRKEYPLEDPNRIDKKNSFFGR